MTVETGEHVGGEGQVTGTGGKGLYREDGGSGWLWEGVGWDRRKSLLMDRMRMAMNVFDKVRMWLEGGTGRRIVECWLLFASIDRTMRIFSLSLCGTERGNKLSPKHTCTWPHKHVVYSDIMNLSNIRS